MLQKVVELTVQATFLNTVHNFNPVKTAQASRLDNRKVTKRKEERKK
jgi:hypothetical protein